MRRFALALSAAVVGMVVSSCAVGVRQPATNITATSATLKARCSRPRAVRQLLHRVRRGPAEAPGAVRAEDAHQGYRLQVNEIEPVSEPITGLAPGRAIYFELGVGSGPFGQDPVGVRDLA